jgi:hypothetical protein
MESDPIKTEEMKKESKIGIRAVKVI